MLLTKMTAAQNKATLSYHRVRGLYFLAAILPRLQFSVYWYIRTSKGFKLHLQKNYFKCFTLLLYRLQGTFLQFSDQVYRESIVQRSDQNC